MLKSNILTSLELLADRKKSTTGKRQSTPTPTPTPTPNPSPELPQTTPSPTISSGKTGQMPDLPDEVSSTRRDELFRLMNGYYDRQTQSAEKTIAGATNRRGKVSAVPGVIKPADQVDTGNQIMMTDGGKAGTSSNGLIYNPATGQSTTTGKPSNEPSAITVSPTAGIPDDYADLAEVVAMLPDNVDFSNWDNMTAKQQLKALEFAGLTEEQMSELLNTSPHYVKTLGYIRDVYANGADHGLTQAETNALIQELLTIAQERDALLNHSEFIANTPRSAAIMKGRLNDREAALLAWLNQDDSELWYNGNQSTRFVAGGGSDLLHSSRPNFAISMTNEGEDVDDGGYIDVPGTPFYDHTGGVNCYGYALMYLGIEPKNGDYIAQPGDLSTGSDFPAWNNEEAYGTNKNEYVQKIADRIVSDVKQSSGDARIIDSYTDAEDGEIVVAVKTKFYVQPDYHVAVLLPDGTWADKMAKGHDSTKGRIENPDDSWSDGFLSFPYSSDTIYIAVTPPEADN